MARDPVFDRAVDLIITGAEEAVQRLFVEEVHRQVDRVYAEAGPDGHEQWIDGRKDAPVETVSPYGEAHFSFRYLPELVAYAGGMLWERSPVDNTWRADEIVYRESRVIFVDGVEAGQLREHASPADLRWLLDYPKGAEITITNEQPYAGLLENGWSDFAPDGVYRLAVDTVRRKWGNVAEIKYSWRKIDGAKRFAPAMLIREL